MTPGEAAALEDRVCLAYEKLQQQVAHRKATGPRIAYRCPFGHGHWHCEALTIDEMHGMAALLRDRHNGETTSIERTEQAR